MAHPNKRLGDLLLEAQLIGPEQLALAIEEQRRTGQLLGETLVGMGLVQEQALLQLLHRQLGLALVDLDTNPPDEAAIAKVKEEMARKYVALPLEVQKRGLVVAMTDPLNVAALEDLRFHTGMFIQPVLAAPSQILAAIDRHYHIDRSMNEVIQSIVQRDAEVEVNAVQEQVDREAAEQLLREAEGRPIVRLTNWLLNRAIEERASDLHIEPQANDLLVRLRVDGLLREERRLPKWTQSAVISRLKVLANLDIAEKRQPQDGRLAVEVNGRRVDMRVSTLPVAHGEKLVLRVVDQSRSLMDLDSLGLGPTDMARLRGFLARPQGILLVTGPTGSGKSSLLYAALRAIQDVTRNITTVEDPVEFLLPGINQMQIEEKARKTFAAALRAILRQDPDVVMIGEIRDRETAEIAFRASVTGHLVLSTVHTNDAAGAVTRLVDLGLEPFMVASALVGVVGMRLVRTLCPRCRVAYVAGPESEARLGTSAGPSAGGVTLWRAVGCAHCNEVGFQGRTGIFEVLEVNEAIRALITRGAPDSEIRVAAIKNGMRPLAEDGTAKALAGVTTVEEVARVAYVPERNVRACSGCGHVLSKGFEFCPSCGMFVGEHCARCHAHFDPAWAFCSACGAPKPTHAAAPGHPTVLGPIAPIALSSSAPTRRAS